ncbi:MAG: DsbA family protein [Kiloniellales bacterium]|nr:DsbA family protein [Kiloniellales bacterium]
MAKRVEVFWSHQSPYCYFALDRILALDRRADVEVVLRPVLPGVLRIPEVFQDATELEQRYFDLDVRRTAAFLGLPYGEARPNPVAFQPGTLFRAAGAQPRVHRLYRLTAAADAGGRGWAYLDQVTRLIWDGTSRDWDRGRALDQAAERAGLDPAALNRAAETRGPEFDRGFAANHEALLASGHWGVPTFVLEGEPFFGQDRFDQLLWRLGGC